MKLKSLSTESLIRQELGIPDDAKHVLIFTESSHWDPNWMFTSEQYFKRFVRNNLDQAIEALQKEPRRIYSIECMFFLRQYWDRFPHQHEPIRNLVNEGRLRLTSSGVTTADTLLPNAEAILRDLLIGQEWLRENGMNQEPDLAYFTDSFGCTPTLPSLLNAAGFDRTAITRVDGMYFMGCDLESPKRFPKPGSTAELLLKKERSLDFIWQDRNHAKVLCHWNAYSYGQGDMLAFGGLSRVYLVRIAFPMPSDRHIARRIKQYVTQLSPYSRTPYMLCPIGFDFVEPIPNLIDLLDRYNQNHYPSTGVWVVNAGLDDYLALVEHHKENLPVLEIDPNPYWTGFYTSRPNLKQSCRELVDSLIMAEKLSLLSQNQEDIEAVKGLKHAWWQAAVSNHHDFITGTSPDKVVEEEQIPWLIEAQNSVNATINHFTPNHQQPERPAERYEIPLWNQGNGKTNIKTTHYEMTLEDDAGGAIMSLRTPDGHIEFLTDLSNDLVSYRDSGGLWRMGHEFSGGTWNESTRASQHPSKMQIIEHQYGVEISSAVELNGEIFRRQMWLSNKSPLIHMRVKGKAAEGHSVTVRFSTAISSRTLVMGTPGGIALRPPTKIYDPTFWPFQQFAHLQEEETGHGLSILQPFPGAISYQPDGTVELVAMRNATKEKAFGFIGIPGNPAIGHERESYTFNYTILFTEKGNWQENNIHLLSRHLVRYGWDDSEYVELQNLADSIVTTDCPQVWVLAVKPAVRGQGIIVRLYSHVLLEYPISVTSAHLKITDALLCDARERDIEPLSVQDNIVRVKMPGTITTIRLLCV